MFGTDGTRSPAPGVIVATIDGGAHWSEAIPDRSAGFQGITFVDDEHGWAVGGGVFATVDGGRTWSRQDVGDDYRLADVTFSDREHGWAMIGHVGLLATENGGRTWTVVMPLGSVDDGFMAISSPQS